MEDLYSFASRKVQSLKNWNKENKSNKAKTTAIKDFSAYQNAVDDPLTSLMQS